ncbi:sensor histidine kinase [Actinoplanes palleronii]|uniref:histidine kinase n=1 Tax=Actinoplanes palleronii TaxID=113570 RepID=A0ABQ4BSM0_9ACTN|nr:HAMP domain-containing sensor histidine kinase [Actinoplanes palleronii]GIE73677.1 putative sensor histidine kinase [Actinoplanes palleronii]
MRIPRPADRLATRLFAAQALIVAVGALTLFLVAVAVAPGLLHNHVSHMMGAMSGPMSQDLEQALAATLSLSLMLAVGAALLASLALSWLLTRRLTAPVTQMAAVAGRIAGGDYTARVPASRLGTEFAALDGAFNQMATTLEHTERRRREMLADLAHELRTPIATVDSFLEGIEDEVIPAGPDTWRTLREQTGRLRRLIDDIDSVSRAEERRLDLRRQTMRLDDAIDDALRAVAVVFADKGVILDHRRHPTPVAVRADPDRLREVLDNLLSNALRHTPSGGTVTVSTTGRPHDAEVTVADTGEGITAEHLDHVFERFYRADPSRSRRGGGSGIGLTIARALAQAHGGSLHAASDGDGCGATFTLTMPTVRQPVDSYPMDPPDDGQSRTG